MFDISFAELFLVAVVGLLVIGPQRLPEALRTLGLWMGRMRRSFINVKTEIEREIGMDEIRRQLHNEAVMEEMKKIQRDVQHSVNPPAQPDRRRGNRADPAAAGGSVGPTGGSQPTADSGAERLPGAVDGPPVTAGSGHPDAADSGHADAAADAGRAGSAADLPHRDTAPGRTEAAQSTDQPPAAGSDDLRHG